MKSLVAASRLLVQTKIAGGAQGALLRGFFGGGLGYFEVLEEYRPVGLASSQAWMLLRERVGYSRGQTCVS